MKPGQIFGALIIAVCIIAAGASLRGSVRQSLSIREVRASPGEPCSMYGKAIKANTHYDLQAGRLTFLLRDEHGDTIPVVYPKAKPETFDMADKIKVIGAYRDGAFQADDMILKCPSKYDSSAPVPGKPGEKLSPYAALGKGA